MKRSLIIYVIVILVGVLPGVCARASVAGDLSAADGQYKAGQYTQAERSCLMVIQQADRNKAGEAEAAFNARKKLSLVYIATDRLPQAEDAVQQLLSRYAQYESLPRAIHEIVEGAEPLYKVAQVRQLYQDMVTARPGDSRAMWLKMGMAIASVHLTDDQATDATIESIIAQHGSDARAAEALDQIAWACRNLRQYSKALTIYQYVVDNWPEKSRVAFAQHGIVMCQLGLGNPKEADAAFDVLLQTFGKDKDASKMVLWAGHGYSDAGEVERASKVYELLVQSYPDTPEAVEAQAALAIRSVLAEDRSKIEPAIQTLLTEFAPSEAQALGLHNIANTIGWKLFGYASGSARGQDVPALFDKCLQAIADYTQVTWPKSDWAMWAQRDLATLAIYRGDDAAADAAIGRLTTNYASSPDTPAALYFLGNYFLEANRDDKAQAVYKVLVEKFPTYDLAPLIKTALGQMRLRQGDDQGAEAIFQEVLATYAKHPRLAEAVNMMGMTYFDQALRTQGWEPGPVPNPPEPARIYMSNAVEKWHLIMDQMAEDPSATPTACSGMVQAYYRLADFEKALHYCREFLQRWPHHADARVVYIVTYKAAKRLMREGVIPEAEARALMQRAQDEIQGKTSSRPLTQEGGSGNGGMIQEQEATHE